MSINNFNSAQNLNVTRDICDAFINSLPPPSDTLHPWGFDNSVSSNDVTQEIKQVLRLFQTVITNTEKARASCGKVVCFDSFSHLAHNIIDEISLARELRPFLFAATSPDESLVSLSNYESPLYDCGVRSWQKIFPVFAKFLDFTYGIRCTERKRTEFVYRYHQTHRNDNPPDALMLKIKSPGPSIYGRGNSRFMFDDYGQMRPAPIVKASELHINSHEYILLWKNKSWEPKALPAYPFPQCAAVNTLIPNNMKFLFDDCAKRQFTDIEITCQGGATFHAHRLVLIAAGDYFKAMLTQKMQEGLSNKLSFSEFDSTTVEIFLKFLYLEQDPFSSEGAESIDAPQLLALSHLCQIEKLTQMCANHIGQNVDENQWKEVGQLGANFQNKYLLQVFECYRNRKGKLLTKEMSLALQKYAGINLPPSPCAKALVHCDVGYGNTLGLFCEPFWDAELPSKFIWKEGKWKGHVPINTDFKFVLINGDSTIKKWENRTEDRKVEQPTGKSIAYDDVKFT